MTNLNRKALIGLLQLTLTIALCIFVPAWTVRFWQGWLLLSILFVSFLAITAYLMKKDPHLLERRIHAGPAAEKYRSQKIGQFFGMLAFIAIFVVAGFDHRFARSSVPTPAAIAGDALVLLGLLTVFFVFKENSFTSATVEVASEQRLISTGPYSVVRHPMYIGALIMFIGVPLALGSWWGVAPLVPMTLVIVQRVRAEEQLLTRDPTDIENTGFRCAIAFYRMSGERIAPSRPRVLFSTGADIRFDIMNQQLSRTSTELDHATLRARKVVESVPSVLVGRRQHHGSWSIAECIAHLTITTDAYIAEIRPAIDRARDEHLGDRGTTFRIGISARILVWWLEPPYRLKTKTPAAFVPGVEEPARALAEFVDRQQRLQAVIAEADGLALDGIRIPSPFAPAVKYNVYAAFRLIAAHQRRHLWQAERVAERLLSRKTGDA